MSQRVSIEQASDWIASAASGRGDIALLGAPIGRASITPSQGWTTPPAFRAGLARFASWDADRRVDLSNLRVRDLGDVVGDEFDADASGAHRRIEAAAAASAETAPLLVVVGGDNSLTRPAFMGLSGGQPGDGWGLLTLDAHHDTRAVTDGISRNGTPVRELIEAGLPGNRVAQIGILGFANGRPTAEWAAAHGIHIYRMPMVGQLGIAAVVAAALSKIRAAGARRIYFDLDVDVVDRAFAPGCPASMPGGLIPAEAATAARIMGEQADVVAMDLTEVDASTDIAGITVRLMCYLFLSFCSGVAERPRTPLDAPLR